ncbi:MAG: class I SAM-dependent methyltransferase [Gammaproteobacteria bacterium]|nr:class I SAM-dependent methyltransferase [Gammaproteobacteria bacterium]MDH5731685.1 class I SAM-dependent methyltransferase [Gammaproteobacteria bacterium]
MNLMKTIYGQFKQPHGFLGRVAGFIMSKRGSNIQRNQWLVDLMHLKTNDSILEIGFGPGLAIEAATKFITQGTIVGIDHSDIMLAQATQRNSTAISNGKVKLSQVDISSLPKLEQSFDHIYSANVIQFWSERTAIFQHLRKSLKQGGKIYNLYMPRHKSATSQDAINMANALTQELGSAGFKNVQTKSRDFDDLTTVCVIAQRA